MYRRFLVFTGTMGFLAAALCGCGGKEPVEADATAWVLQWKRTNQLGTFEITGEELVVSDPGYDLATARIEGLGAVLTNCRRGMWRAESITKHFDPPGFALTSELRVFHSEVADLEGLKWEKQSKPIGVDYGQAGVYDVKFFHEHNLVPKEIEWTFENSTPADPDDLWYSFCCELTKSNAAGAVFPFGVVTNSGKGDGGYEYSLARNAEGKIIGVWIVFVDDLGSG